WVFDIEQGTQTAICQHNTSWKVLDGDRQVTHPHPSFSPDNKWVLYTSDEEGMPALYLARV
ncbi:MAG: oligogalacturonate lyase family protein, partial [Leclercia adecarboxylata]|nr:oligogalacturonate lyase family protein [Leclercia adecarboxylata]